MMPKATAEFAREPNAVFGSTMSRLAARRPARRVW
jgi:hypothetical protein